jgi:hypothetical protein
MAYTKQSVHDDDQLRLAAKSLIVLRNEKLAAIAKALQFDPGGISGWLGGTPNRISLEKKEIISTYLGLEYTHISPKIVHHWSTNAEDIKTLLPLVINKEMLQHICINQITSDTIPVGCVYYSITGNITLVVLCVPRKKAFPIPIVAPEDTGWGNILPPIDVAKSTWDSWWADQNTTPEEIAAYLSIAQKTTNHSALESWASLVAELIQRGANIDSARQCLKTKV